MNLEFPVSNFGISKMSFLQEEIHFILTFPRDAPDELPLVAWVAGMVCHDALVVALILLLHL
jgi:hypothetical protein